jgi:hypothetical protein
MHSMARALHDQLMALVASVTAAEGSTLSPREFLQRQDQTPVDFLIGSLLDGLARMRNFALETTVLPFSPRET